MSSSSSKSTLQNHEEAIMNLLASRPEGINNAIITSQIPGITLEQIIDSINLLSSKAQLEILKSPEDDTLWYRAVVCNQLIAQSSSSSDAKSISNSTASNNQPPPSDPDERMIWQVIRNAENKGAWTKDIKVKTGLHQNIVNKILKNLEARHIIKAVKTKNSTRKVYMLWDVEPSLEITGGPWFSENDLDVEFIEGLSKVCANFIASKCSSMSLDSLPLPTLANPNSQKTPPFPTLEQIHSFVAMSGVTSLELSLEDIEAILDTLVWDGKIEKLNGSCYRTNRACTGGGGGHHLGMKSPLASLPCGRCPLAVGRCVAWGGPVTPVKCSYFDAWLS